MLQSVCERSVFSDRSCFALGEFYNYELFTMHADNHAMEDVTIPVISKDLLKTVKFARCEWVGCEAAFKSKSHLKSHLNSHTQKKLIACPVCGLAFCTKVDTYFILDVLITNLAPPTDWLPQPLLSPGNAYCS